MALAGLSTGTDGSWLEALVLFSSATYSTALVVLVVWGDERSAAYRGWISGLVCCVLAVGLIVLVTVLVRADGWGLRCVAALIAVGYAFFLAQIVRGRIKTKRSTACGDSPKSDQSSHNA